MRIQYDLKTYLAQCLTQKSGRLVLPTEVQIVASTQPTDGVQYHGKAGDDEVYVPLPRSDLTQVFNHLTKKTLTAVNSKLLVTFEQLIGMDLAESDWTTAEVGNAIVLTPTARNKVWTGSLTIPADLQFVLNANAFTKAAYAPGVVAGGNGPASKPGKMTTGKTLLQGVVSKNYLADSNNAAWRFDHDLYVVGSGIKRSEVAALGLDPADAVTSTKSFKIAANAYSYDYWGYGYYDINLDTGVWSYINLYTVQNTGSTRVKYSNVSSVIAPPAARHIRLIAINSTKGDHYLNFSITSV